MKTNIFNGNFIGYHVSKIIKKFAHLEAKLHEIASCGNPLYIGTLDIDSEEIPLLVSRYHVSEKFYTSLGKKIRMYINEYFIDLVALSFISF